MNEQRTLVKRLDPGLEGWGCSNCTWIFFCSAGHKCIPANMNAMDVLQVEFANHNCTLSAERAEPNSLTISAMQAGDRGNVTSFDGIDALMADLYADDAEAASEAKALSLESA